MNFLVNSMVKSNTVASNSKWYRDGLAFECVQCNGCCGGFPGYVWLTRADAFRLAEALKLEPQAFYDEYCFREDGRFSLKEDEDYNCILLRDDGGCSQYEARPHQCREFPFWSDNLRSRAAWNRAAKDCPGMNNGKLHSAERIAEIRSSKSDEDKS